MMETATVPLLATAADNDKEVEAEGTALGLDVWIEGTTLELDDWGEIGTHRLHQNPIEKVFFHSE